MISSIFERRNNFCILPVLVIGVAVAGAIRTSQLALFMTSFTGTDAQAIPGHPGYFHARA